ncbi:putative GH25 family protein [Sphingobium wenxiniae]|uniref:Nickel transporter n=2 Tax=Sphingobium TaxID=165695 RepID=T0GZV5_9SPHN|nr:MULTISPECIES: DUF4198 domain-containing protein [Sphingobium]EQB06252.1 nickel transporter [Sphingobium baderi LL03]KMS62703.1 nickel transporter [Sphingobium baderi LL03]MBB6190799.1 putative GH25 family protein [Sphingobium wenxiniae]TWH94576.1 putative GH25 family protein [Sphingobium wenxiniae]WRD76836.1 DUF4198 domain-containing protein [Sphingobium baderi]
MKARLLIAGALAALTMSGTAQAHRQWMLPSSTVLSGTDNWVTVDAAISNDLFYFEHHPMRTDSITVTQPDGSAGKVENAATGKYRSTFDVHLTQPGTYRIASVSAGLMGSYMLNGKRERLPRGTTKETLAKAIPAGATDVQTAEAASRNEIFVTLGAPTANLFKPTGVGLEMVPVTHPNDLVSGESATFQFLLDGKPASGLKVTVIPGGIRYRDALGQMDLTTGADGKLSITWPQPGMYWLNASTGGGEGGPGAAQGEGAPQAPQEPAGPPQRRASYVSTLEVLAP